MSKFKIGDKFVAKETGLTGQVKGMSYNSIHQENEYVVIWDNRPNTEESYSVDLCDLLWDHLIIEEHARVIQKTLKECEHNYVEYLGFSEQYEYCSKCDKRR